MQCTFPRHILLSNQTIALGFLSVITLLQLDVRIASAQLAQNAPKFERPGIQVFRDVPYGPHEIRNTFDLYVPEKASGSLPLVIWIHGGAWLNGSKDRTQAVRLLDSGFAVASLNYRLSQNAIFPAQIHDCKAAIRHLRANASEYRLDPERFGVWGSSAGGHLAALVGTSGNAPKLEGEVGKHLNVSSNVQAVCDWFGPTDFLQMGGSHNKPDSPESRLVGGAIQENPEKVAAANPIVYVDKNDPPILIMHGDQDPLVPFSQSVLFEASLQAAGVQVELVKMEGEGHGGRGFDSPKAREQVTSFFTKVLHPEMAKAADPASK